MKVHPALIHFPIAFSFLEAFFLGLSKFKKDISYTQQAYWIFKLSYILMIAAAIAGYIDAGGIQKIRGEVLEHVLAALSFAGINTLRLFYWRAQLRREMPNGTGLLLAALAAAAAAAVTGFFGGELVYG